MPGSGRRRDRDWFLVGALCAGLIVSGCVAAALIWLVLVYVS